MAKFCKQCGAQLDDDAVFCLKCGASQVQADQVPPQPQPQPQQPQFQQPQYQQPQYQQPQYQPQFQQPQYQPKPVRTGPSIFSGIGFAKEDFKFNPVKELTSGDVSRYSIFALCLTLFAFFLSMINVFRDFAGDDSFTMQYLAHDGEFTALSVFRYIFMVLFIAAVVWVMFKMFLKKANFFDLLILGGATFFWFIINMIGMIVIGSESGGFLRLTFAGVFFYIAVFVAISACVLPLVFKLIKKK